MSKFTDLSTDEKINTIIQNSESEPHMEPELIKTMDSIIQSALDSKKYESALLAGERIIQKSNPYAFTKIAPFLFAGFTSMKWQIRQFSLQLMSAYARHHPTIVSQNMPEIINQLITISQDPKVKQCVIECFQNVCSTIENVDIKHLIPIVIACYMNPVQETQKALDALVSTPFVNDIDIPTMGLLIPLLIKSMRERKMVYQRRAAVVIETLTKLLKNPVYAKMFYPILEPVLTKGYEEIAEVEIRNVCLNSRNVLTAVYDLGVNKSLESYTLEDCRKTFLDNIGDVGENMALVDYSIDLIWNLVKHEIKDESLWHSCIHPYLKCVIDDACSVEAATAKIASTIISTITVEEFNPEDDEENLCDCVFSLAYGTRVLLHQTPFKVKIGRKYGLVGP